jgi:hypothetical protein
LPGAIVRCRARVLLSTADFHGRCHTHRDARCALWRRPLPRHSGARAARTRNPLGRNDRGWMDSGFAPRKRRAPE